MTSQEDMHKDSLLSQHNDGVGPTSDAQGPQSSGD